MKERELQSVIDQLVSVKRIENKLGLLYEACASEWPEEASFFMAIQRDEDQHEKNLEQMIQLITRQPDRFERGRPISPAAVNTFIAGIEKAIESLKQGQISKEKMLYLARDYENSIIEKNYHEVVKTSDRAYTSLAALLVRESATHKSAIEKKISELTRRP